ncbi:MAG: cation diffusion facilitator family transporter [Actinomycetota bacterium]
MTADTGHDHTGHDHTGHDHTGYHRPQGFAGRLRALLVPHRHDSTVALDRELETSRQGMRVLLISFVALLVTALLQGLVVLVTGSVALLGDTIHNLSDALTAAPIAVAFTVGRRAPTRRYTYGFGRAEDLAGIVVVLLIAASAALAGYEAVRRLVDPQPVTHTGLVALAGVIGFLGNELVARYRIRVGRRIGSAALVADGLHARTDGFTSLAVVVGAAGVALGLPIADPLVGLAITVAILVVLRDAAREVYRRLMDAVEPELVSQVAAVARATPGVRELGEVRLRWIGHALRAEIEVVVDPGLTVVAAHRIAEETEHNLLHEVPRLTAALVHADPDAPPDAPADDHHQLLRHHRPADASDVSERRPALAVRRGRSRG